MLEKSIMTGSQYSTVKDTIVKCQIIPEDIKKLPVQIPWGLLCLLLPTEPTSEKAGPSVPRLLLRSIGKGLCQKAW